MWDVTVVGSGPAGAAAAIAARRVLPQGRVALLDRSDFPRDKTCGDGVAPHTLDVLARLGVRGLLDDWTPVHRLRLGFSNGPVLAGEMLRPAYIVPRVVLDARLRAVALGLGAEPLRHRVRRVDVADGRVTLDGELDARVVIGADGAHSAVRAAVAAPPPEGCTAIAVRAYTPIGTLPADEQVIAFDRRAGAGYPAYAWAFPVGDGTANVGYGELLAGPGRGPTRARLLDRLHDLLPEVGELDGVRGHHLPLSTARTHQPDGRVLLAGDALSLVNPLTGEGIHAAVLSGALAGIAAARAVRGTVPDAGRDYRTALRGAYGRHLRDVGLLARLAHPRAVAAGLRGSTNSQRVFDDLVDLGLADGPLTGAVLRVIGRELMRKATRWGR
jgi:geranylgeranyl reductase family protein